MTYIAIRFAVVTEIILHFLMAQQTDPQNSGNIVVQHSIQLHQQDDLWLCSLYPTLTPRGRDSNFIITGPTVPYVSLDTLQFLMHLFCIAPNELQFSLCLVYDRFVCLSSSTFRPPCLEMQETVVLLRAIFVKDAMFGLLFPLTNMKNLWFMI